MSEDWLKASPLPASVCPNCGGYYLVPGCVCGWRVPNVVVSVEDEDVAEVDEPTDAELLGDPPGGEAGV